MVFSRHFSAPQNLAAAARNMVDDFSFVQQRKKGQESSHGQLSDRWSPPSNGYVKINWDAAINPGLRRMGIGVVIRDNAGGFVAAQIKNFPFMVDTTVAEAWGTWCVMRLGCELGLTHVQLEGDALNVVTTLKKEGPCLSPYVLSSDDLILSPACTQSGQFGGP